MMEAARIGSDVASEKLLMALWSPFRATMRWWYARFLVSTDFVSAARFVAEKPRMAFMTKSFPAVKSKKLHRINISTQFSDTISKVPTQEAYRPKQCKSTSPSAEDHGRWCRCGAQDFDRPC